MAIDARCPFCSKAYRLKDDLVGKKVTCANGECRKVFAVEVIKNAPPMDAETLAMAALSDVPAEEVPVESRTIAMTCVMCDHKWAAAWDMQGKNVLCPDCKHRQKVPEQKVNKAADWRTGGGGPSLAKKETLEGVTSARDTAMVSGETLLKTGVIDDGIEPLSLKVKLQRAALVLLALGLAIGLWLYIRGNKRENAAYVDFEKNSSVADGDDFATLPLHRALLHMGYAEYAARQNDPKLLLKAVELYDKAREDLSGAPKGGDRDALTGELALSLLSLGGTGPALIEKTKIPWVPADASGSRAQIRNTSAEDGGVVRLLQRVFAVMLANNADFDLRAWTARRLTRVLIAKGQPKVILDCMNAGFTKLEQPEIQGQIGLELFRAGDTALARTVAMNIVADLQTNPPTNPTPTSAHALWHLLDIKGPIPDITETSGPPIDGVRQTFTAQHLAKKDAAAALAMASRPGPADSRVRALALGAEIAEAPEPFVEAASKVLDEPKAEGSAMIQQYPLLRLAAIAGRIGDKAKSDKFIKAINDPTLRVYATAEALRQKMNARKTEIVPDSDAELPADVNAKDFMLGHAWGRFNLARINGYNASATKSKEYADNWPKPLVAPFGAIGAMLGVQDKQSP